MRIGALQSSYLPWLGFFDQIARCDLFVIYDDLQYTRKDWRNRNRIKTPNGPLWLTVPVAVSGPGPALIREVRIASDPGWSGRHWRMIRTNYARAPHFAAGAPWFEELYRRRWTLLADLNREVLSHCLDALGIRTPVIHSAEAGLERWFRRWRPGGDATDRILFLCRHFGAESFVEGSAGRAYIDLGRIERAGIALEFQDYRHPGYRQLFGPFIPYLSIVDLLFNEGENSLAILRAREP